MPRFGTPDEAPSPVLGGETPERADDTATLVFIGGTGRSGTHVLSRLIGRHNRYALIPVEVRFHTDPEGFPGLLAGEVTPEAFLKRMRGFWWKGFQAQGLSGRFRGMYRFVDPDLYEEALAAFERDHEADLAAACRSLFYDLLWFRVTELPRAHALVEQSTDNVAAAPTLARSSPRRGSSTWCATGATPRPPAWPRRAGWCARAPGCRGSSGGSSASARSKPGPTRSRRGSCSR